MADPQLVTTLAKIQDDLVYVLEELLRDCTGEARSELTDVLRRLDAQTAVLGADLADQLRHWLQEELPRLRGGGRGDGHRTLIALRRGLRNAQLRLEGQPEIYPYGAKLRWPGSAVATGPGRA